MYQTCMIIGTTAYYQSGALSEDDESTLPEMARGQRLQRMADFPAERMPPTAEERAGLYRSVHDLVHLYAAGITAGHSKADRRKRSAGRLLGYYLHMAAADAHLRALPGADMPGEFTRRDDALAWLDAERASRLLERPPSTGTEPATSPASDTTSQPEPNQPPGSWRDRRGGRG